MLNPMPGFVVLTIIALDRVTFLWRFGAGNDTEIWDKLSYLTKSRSARLFMQINSLSRKADFLKNKKV